MLLIFFTGMLCGALAGVVCVYITLLVRNHRRKKHGFKTSEKGTMYQESTLLHFNIEEHAAERFRN